MDQTNGLVNYYLLLFLDVVANSLDNRSTRIKQHRPDLHQEAIWKNKPTSHKHTMSSKVHPVKPITGMP